MDISPNIECVVGPKLIVRNPVRAIDNGRYVERI